MYEDVMTKMIETGLDRKAVLIAFGGGVIGDLGGFCRCYVYERDSILSSTYDGSCA